MKGIRVLIARKDSHRSYGDALQGTIRGLRPGAEVSLARVEELGHEVACLESHLVVCGRPNDVDSGNRARRRDSRPTCPERTVAPRPPGANPGSSVENTILTEPLRGVTIPGHGRGTIARESPEDRAAIRGVAQK